MKNRIEQLILMVIAALLGASFDGNVSSAVTALMN